MVQRPEPRIAFVAPFITAMAVMACVSEQGERTADIAALRTKLEAEAKADRFAGAALLAWLENGLGSVGHGGGAPGMNGDLRIYPSTGYVVAVLSNLDPPAASDISAFMHERVMKGWQ